MHKGMAVGILAWTNPPLVLSRATLLFARLMRLDSVLAVDHFQSFMPTAIWDRDLSWASAWFHSPHELFDHQVLLGYLARSAGRLRIGVGVTEPGRRHPVLIAQSILTLAHMVRRRPILGIGAGERGNIDPYGLDFSRPVGRLEEALQVIRLCFSSRGPIDFTGEHYRLDGAVIDLRAPEGRTPEIWIAGHGPRMLRLTGQYGNGWLPTMVTGPQEYAAMLEVVRATARQAGRNPEALTPALHQFVMIARTEGEASAMLNSKLLRFATLCGLPASDWRKAGVEHPFGQEYRGYIDFIPERYDLYTLEEAMQAVPAHLIGRGFVIGTAPKVLAKLREFQAAGVRHLVLSLPAALFSMRAAIYGQLSIPSLAWRLRSGQ